MDNKILFNEDVIIRPETTTRKEIKIVVSQRESDDGKIAMATATLIGSFPTYHEKPDILEDMAMAQIYAARLMRKLNKKVKNGK